MNEIVILPEKKDEAYPFYRRIKKTDDSPFLFSIQTVCSLDKMTPIPKTILNVIVNGKPAVLELNDEQMKKFIEISNKMKEPTRFKKIMNWIADNLLFTNSLRFVRKHAGGRWEQWWVGLPICHSVWFRGYNGSCTKLTSEGLPLLRAMLQEEDWK